MASISSATASSSIRLSQGHGAFFQSSFSGASSASFFKRKTVGPVRKKCSVCVASQTENCSHSPSTSASEVMFASTSQSTAPTSSPSSAATLFPAALGAGLLGAAAVALLKKGDRKAPVSAEDLLGPPVLKTSLDQENLIFPRGRTAAPAAISTMAKIFPTAMTEETFVQTLSAELAPLGFKKDNCIALVNTCRDEVCRPLVNLIDREFGLSFNISGLGGLVNCGKTGFKAAMSHSPEFPCDVDGTPKERYIFFAFPHVSVGEGGEVGSLLRRGRGKPSSACGALIAIKNDIASGGKVVEDELDAEYVLLKQKVISKIPNTTDLGLSDVTKAALKAITEDLEKLVSLTVDPKTADFVVVTGVQIHSGNQIPGEPFLLERTCDYIAPHTMYAVVRGQRYELQYPNKKTVASIAA